MADFGSDSAERVITVSCNIAPLHNLASLVGVLTALPVVRSQKGLKQLVFDDVPDRYFTARLQDAVNCERLIRSAGAFDLNFSVPTHMLTL